MSITLFYGVPGAGKTTAMMDYVNMHAFHQRFFVVDRVGEWGINDPENFDKPNPRWRGRRLPIIEVSKDEETDFSQNGIYLFQYPWEGNEVAEVCRAVGNATYVDDEIDLVATFKGWTESPLRDFVHRGRHLPNADGEIGRVNILGAARRPQNLHTDLTSLADQVLIFRVQGHRTLERMVLDSMVTDDMWDEIRLQKTFDYVLWKSDGTITRGYVTDPFKR